MSKHHGDFYCLNCLESHKNVRQNKDFSYVAMPSEDTKTLEVN